MKRRTKKLFSMLLSLALVVGMLPVVSMAAGTNTVTVTTIPSGGGTATLAHAPSVYSTETMINTEDGEQVNVICNPNPGYQLSDIYISGDGYNKSLDISKQKYFITNGTGKNYQVRVTFEKIQYDIKREVIPPNSRLPGQAIDAQYDSVVSWPKTAGVGDPVRLKIVPVSGYEIESVQWQASGDTSWKNVTTYDGVGVSFTMPAANVYFKVDVKEAQPRVSTVSLPDATVGEYYYAKVEASGGYQPLYMWEEMQKSCPGLIVSGYHERFMSLYGTPKEAGTYSIVVKVSNYSGLTDVKIFDLKVNPAIESNPFVDVSGSDYFYEPVLWAVKKGITNGTDDTHFSPNSTCTRGQVVTFLWRAAGSPAPSSTTNPFTDVNASDYYYNAVLWAVGKNITKGISDTTFGPNDGCTRGQVVTFLHRFENAPTPASSTNPFVDVSSSEYYYTPVLWAVGKGITNGTDATHFSPDDTCTRGQIVTFLYRDMK